MRPLRLLGAFLVFLSVGLLAFFILLDIVAGLANPYLGIIAYLILPAILVIGLLLVPLDSWLERRRIARGGPEYPVIDLCDPYQRRIATFFAAASVLVLVVMTVVTYKGVEYMDTTTFCGKVCHRVMIPEYTAYRRSSHASVACIECHIGPGAPWFVRSKLSGIPQIWHYTIGDYDRPLKTPVRALRPSRDTCEHCHTPQAFYGSTLHTTITYDQDRDNTRKVTTMLMRVGSGGVPGSGIHSHIVSRIYYLPAVPNLSEIAWVSVRRPDGSAQEFVNPDYKDKLGSIRKRQQVRFMDCIDCHNRAAHDFEPFEVLLDDAITRQRVDPTLPFIKKLAMEAVGEIRGVPTEAEKRGTINRIRQIQRYYQRGLPDVYWSRLGDIRRSVRAIAEVYDGSVFPHMRVWPGIRTPGSPPEEPGTYPNWRTHTGCFRCHGVLQATGSGRGTEVSSDCNFCHTQPAPAATSGLPAAVPVNP